MDVTTPSGILPQVSVVLPVYNGEHYLAEAIESILAQTFTDFEFIIVDDGSTDGTAGILERYAGRDGRIHVLRNSVNCGFAPTLNRGIECARGEFIARQDADDVSVPGRLAPQVDFLRRHPDHVLVGSQIRVMQEADGATRQTSFPLEHEAILEALISGSCLGHGSVMFRRSARLPFTVESRPAEDYDMWIRMIWLGKFANLPDCLYYYRLWHNSISVKRRDAQRAMAGQIGATHRRRLAEQGRHDILLRSYLRGNLTVDESADVGARLRTARFSPNEREALRATAGANLPAFRTNRHRMAADMTVIRHCLGTGAALRWLALQTFGRLTTKR